MCVFSDPIFNLCKSIANKEFALEQVLCDSSEAQIIHALGLLRKRGDTRALEILESFTKVKQIVNKKFVPLDENFDEKVNRLLGNINIYVEE